jgi:hypothetical protein
MSRGTWRRRSWWACRRSGRVRGGGMAGSNERRGGCTRCARRIGICGGGRISSRSSFPSAKIQGRWRGHGVVEDESRRGRVGRQFISVSQCPASSFAAQLQEAPLNARRESKKRRSVSSASGVGGSSWEGSLNSAGIRDKVPNAGVGVVATHYAWRCPRG